MKIFTCLLFLFAMSAMAGDDPVKRFSWEAGTVYPSGYRGVPFVRDPFYPNDAKFLLKGIISGELAFINNRWVREGDQIEGYTVVTVDEKQVALRRSSEELVLKLH